MFAFVTFADAENARTLIDLAEDHLIKGCSVSVAYASPMKPNEKRRNNAPKMPGGMPDNPMEAMGMAMSMMKTWMGEPDPSQQQKRTQRGGKAPAAVGYQAQQPGAPSWKQGDGGYYGGGFGGGYGGGGVW